MDIKATTEALRWLFHEHHGRAIIVLDSISTLQKVQREFLYDDWMGGVMADAGDLRFVFTF